MFQTLLKEYFKKKFLGVKKLIQKEPPIIKLKV